MLFHCRIPGHRFTAYQEGKGELPSAAPVATLERKVGPGFRDVARTLEVEVTPAEGGKPRRERQVQRTRERVARVSLGRGVLRETLEVEARDEIEAEAIYRRFVGVKSEGTSRQIEVKPASASATEGARAEETSAAPRKLTAEEQARQLVGGHVPREE